MRLTPSLCSMALGLALALADSAGAARILALFTIPGRSHFIVTSSLARALAERGHEVVVVSPFTTSNPPANYTDLTISDPMDTAAKTDFYSLGNLSPVAMLLYMWSMGVGMCRGNLADPKLKTLIHSKEKFDLLSAFGGAVWMGDWVGNPSPPAYVPDPFLDFSDRMSFKQRLINTALGVLERAGRAYYYLPGMDAAMREGFEDPDMPYIADIERKTSVVLVNSHFSVSYPRPAVPAYVQVGGLHIKKPKPLPQELRAWLDAAPAEGFIYFSMGSNLRSADMPAAKREAFLRAFAALPQRVLWKWEEDTLPGQPPNVRLAKWLPQQDILAHPKLRLFITHGGLMSTQEAVYHGVPVVGIPIFGDQQLNMNRAAAAGIGVALNFQVGAAAFALARLREPFAWRGRRSVERIALPQDVTAEALGATLRRVLGDATYRQAAKRLSAVFHDRPRPPMEEAVYWTEYVIRHGGAHHLRSAALEVGWWQYLLLDVVAALAAATALVAALAWLAARALLRRLCGGGGGRVKPSDKRD
ncbi:UDP-glucuronosyltransferase [Gryllus bimaculatus]|nr:UDP-glucuronosyltransferase [Gryllus bimaculatus]